MTICFFIDASKYAHGVYHAPPPSVHTVDENKYNCFCIIIKADGKTMKVGTAGQIVEIYIAISSKTVRLLEGLIFNNSNPTSQYNSDSYR